MKTLSRQIFAFIISFALVFSLLGCSKSADENNGDVNTNDPNSYFADCLINHENVKNVILIIGDGMGEAQLDAGELLYQKEFAFRDSLTKIYSDTNSLNTDTDEATKTTDSAAAATALATGTLTYNGRIGVDKGANELTTILDIAKKSGKSTAVVTTDYLSGATPASFTAHALDRKSQGEIIKSQAVSGVDLLIGQYDDAYDEHRSEIEKNYNYIRNFNREAVLALNTEDTMCLLNIEKSSSDSVALKDVSELAIDYVKDDSDGFVLVIEQAHIDKKSHDNDILGTAKAASSLNDTVELVLNFASKRTDTAVIVTADHETGGLKVDKSTTAYESKYTDGENVLFSYEYASTSHSKTNVPFYFCGFELKPEKLNTFSSSTKIKNREVFIIMRDLIIKEQVSE